MALDASTTEEATITLDELRRRLDDDSLVIVDVLPRESWAAGHIPGALSLPLAEIPDRVSTVLPDRAAEIAIYCGGPT